MSDWSSDVCSSDLDADDAVLVAPTPTTAAGDGRLVLVETENRQHRAAALVEIGLTLAVVEAVAHLVIARRLRLGLDGPQVRPADGMGDHQAQRDPRMGGQRRAHGGGALRSAERRGGKEGVRTWRLRRGPY